MASSMLVAHMQRNLALHHSALQATSPGMRVARVAGLQCVHGLVSGDTFNSVCPLQLGNPIQWEDVCAALQWFDRAPFSWRVLPATLAKDTERMLLRAGLVCVEEERAMWLDLAAQEACSETPPANTALSVHRVDSADRLQQFATIVAANWEPEDPAVLAFYQRVEQAVLRPESPVHLLVGEVDGVAVCAAECCVDAPGEEAAPEATVPGFAVPGAIGPEEVWPSLAGQGVAGLYCISTLKDYRRRGYGLAITRAALREAQRAGCTLAVLQASAQGAGLYARLGFQDCGLVREWQPAGQASR